MDTCENCGSKVFKLGCVNCDEENYIDEQEENNEPDYYLCYSCGYNCVTKHGAAGCPKCTAIMSPEYY